MRPFADHRGNEQRLAKVELRESRATPVLSLRTVSTFERDLPALPRPLTTFIGRSEEAAELVARVRDGARLVTLTGPGGVGKTRLAIHAAEPLAADFPDGVAFVPLASILDPEQLVPAIAQVFGVRGESHHDLASRLVGELRGRRLLLILDNVEQIRDAAPTIADLLADCPWLHVLATSRTRLHLSGENVLRVPPLKLLEAEGDLVSADPFHSESVQLFVDRARSVNQAFVWNADIAEAVAEICRRLDGLPLAIELAAVRVTVLPPAGLLARLRQRLPLLVGGPCDAPARQQMGRNTIAWSHDLLSPEEQKLFRRLGVFVGDWTLEAAEVVANPDDDLDVLGHLAALIDANLVRLDESQTLPRYGMLETIREFAAERLAESPDEDRVREAHARFMLDVASRAWWAFPERHYVKDGQEWLERTLSGMEATSNEARATALASAALATFNYGDFATAVQLAEASLDLGHAGGYDLQIGLALYALLLVFKERGEFARSVAFGEACIDHFRCSGDEHWLSEGLVLTWCSALLGGDAHRAAQLKEEGFALCRKVGNILGLALANNDLGAEAEMRGDLDSALAGYREALELKLTIEEHVYIAHPLAGVASILSQRGQEELAAHLLGVATRIHETYGTFAWIAEKERDARTASRLKSRLGEARYTASLAAGRELSVAAAARLALAATAESSCETPSARKTSSPRSANVREEASTINVALSRSGGTGAQAASVNPNALTAREQEILYLLGQRFSDAEIAEQLYIGVRTVEFHVSNILGKLGAANRREAAMLATRSRPS
jgi:predicted ATPase/DNA-binding NarL/FixJ family response regulator